MVVDIDFHVCVELNFPTSQGKFNYGPFYQFTYSNSNEKRMTTVLRAIIFSEL